MRRSTTGSSPGPVPAATSARAGSVGLALFAALAVAHLAAGWRPDPRWWGVHALAFLPGFWWFAAGAVLGGLVLAGIAARAGAALTSFAAALLVSWRRALVVAVACGALFYALRLEFPFLGDGVVWLERIERGGRFHYFEPLSSAVVAFVARRAPQPTAAAGWPSIALGLIYVAATAALARRLWRHHEVRALGWMLLVVHPALLLFCGYIESYPFLLVLQVLLAWAIAAARPGWRWGLGVTVLWAFAIASHFQALAWAPALFLLPGVVDPQSAGRRAWVRGAASVAAAVVLALVLVKLVGERPFGILAQLPGDRGLGWLRPGAILGWRHLLDLANETALVAGAAGLLAVPLAAVRWFDPRMFRGRWLALAALLPGPVLFALAVPARIGGARDWDLFLGGFVPFTLLAVEAWGQRLPASPRLLRTLAGRALGFAIVASAAWLAVNADAGRALRRFEVLHASSGMLGGYARGYAQETLGIYWRERDRARAREAYARATEANPGNARYWNNLGNAELKVRNVEAARDAFQRALDLGMREWYVLVNLALCHLQLGRPDESLRFAVELIERHPERWQGWAARAQANIEMGTPAAALPDLERAAGLAPREAQIRYVRGLALRDLGRAAEARSAWQEALRIDPQHAPSRNALAKAAEGR
jgi:tetratricopeptide (TPR) repeat protein